MKNMNILDQIKETTNYIRNQIQDKPKIAIIVGSGLSNLKNIITDTKSISYSQIPHFKHSTVEGHKGEMVFGKLNNIDVLLLNGRLHYYEGYTQQEISYPVRVLKYLGIDQIIVTCAVGSINETYTPGDIVLIKDHINFSFNNPLIGQHVAEFGARFPDMTEIYSKELRNKILKIAKKENIIVHEGVYFAVSGPSYETPAEIKAFRRLGGDVVGMSLIAETIVAKQMDMKVLALTYISNKASGISEQTLSHEEVLEVGKKAALSMEGLIKEIVKEL